MTRAGATIVRPGIERHPSAVRRDRRALNKAVARVPQPFLLRRGSESQQTDAGRIARRHEQNLARHRAPTARPRRSPRTTNSGDPPLTAATKIGVLPFWWNE